MADSELIAGFRSLVVETRQRLLLELEYVAELDRRKLFFHYSSLRSYLVAEFGLEEWNADRKIRSARLLRRLPELKAGLESGALNLTLLELAMGAASREKLSDPELLALCLALSGMSCKEAMREIARRFPGTIELPVDKIIPLTGDLSEIRFVAPQDLVELLEEIRGMLANLHPKLSMAELIQVLADEYRERHHPEAKAKRSEERKSRTEKVITPTAPRAEEGRYPSQQLLHELTQNTGYRCSYVDPVTRKRCWSQHALEVDHILPWAEGGKTEISNLRYLCRNHHARVSFLKFGESSKYRRPAS